MTATILLGITLGAFAEWNPAAEGFLIFNLFNSNPIPEEEMANQDGLYSNDEVNVLVWGDWIEPSYDNSLNYGLGGMFGRGKTLNTGIGFRNSFNFMLPQHNYETDANAPVGNGIVLLLGFGAAYAMKKRREE